VRVDSDHRRQGIATALTLPGDRQAGQSCGRSAAETTTTTPRRPADRQCAASTRRRPRPQHAARTTTSSRKRDVFLYARWTEGVSGVRQQSGVLANVIPSLRRISSALAEERDPSLRPQDGRASHDLGGGHTASARRASVDKTPTLPHCLRLVLRVHVDDRVASRAADVLMVRVPDAAAGENGHVLPAGYVTARALGLRARADHRSCRENGRGALGVPCRPHRRGAVRGTRRGAALHAGTGPEARSAGPGLGIWAGPATDVPDEETTRNGDEGIGAQAVGEVVTKEEKRNEMRARRRA